jgi:hypothetical protein
MFNMKNLGRVTKENIVEILDVVVRPHLVDKRLWGGAQILGIGETFGMACIKTTVSICKLDYQGKMTC